MVLIFTVITAVTYSQVDEITVTPPAIIAIAYSPKTADNEIGEVLSDFSFHLSFAMRKLKPLGINFYIIEKQQASFRFLNKSGSIDLAEENAVVGYVFISSEGEVFKRYHVMADAEIIELAEKHFNLKVPR